MTLIKSILLGSAAGIVAVAGAQAADLPTQKAAPVAQYVKICNVGGITGWTLPGSDTCVKLSGYITAQFTGGNLSDPVQLGRVDPVGYAQAIDPFASATRPAILVQGGDRASPISTRSWRSRSAIDAAAISRTTTFYRHATGWTTRANFGFDFASNTAYGPLIGHFDINAETGNGFDNTRQQHLPQHRLPDLGRHHRR